MRKRSIAMLLDKLFYFLLLLLPLFVTLLSFVFNYPKTNDICADFLNYIGFATTINSSILSGGIETFYIVFDGTNGFVADMFQSLFLDMFGLDFYFISSYLQYVVLLALAHILVDVILLLPRVCKKLISKIGGDDVG